jgi:sulfur-oxidizing protein SoxA
MSGVWRAASILMLAWVATSATAADLRPEDKRSDTLNMSAELQAIQADDAANPASLWVLDGEALWGRKPSAEQKSCGECHGDAQSSMSGVAARYPAFDEKRARVVDLEERINLCRADHQKAPRYAPESRDLLALTGFIGRQSRGQAIVSDDPRLRATIETGRQLFSARQGQLNLSCATCHDDNWGRKLGSVTVPQAHPTGYPVYRLEWQSLGSLQRRLRNCMIGMRAEPYPYGSAEYIALEAFLMSRARGLPVETPAVRP